MTVKIIVPELGESVVEATVGRWLKKEGERVNAGETVVELETDKVDLEVGAERAGVLAHIEKKEGEDVKVGDVLGTIEQAPERVPAPSAAKPSGEPERAPTAPPPTRPEEPVRAEPHNGGHAAPAAATPVAQRLADERGIDIAKVSGTGPGGRVTKQDVERYGEPTSPPAPSQQGEGSREEPVSTPSMTGERQGEIAPSLVGQGLGVSERGKVEDHAPVSGVAGDRSERVRMSRRRRTIAERLLQAKQTTAMLTTFNEVDMHAVMEIRQRRRETFKEKYGVGLGITSFFVKATISALKAFPRLNAEIQGDEIVLKHYYDIGVAVGAEEGLVVPVLRDADRMSFAEIEKAIKEFAQKAGDGTLSIEDLRGGTFTITNGGVFGSLNSTPILNLPQVGILGLHKIEDRPIALNGQVVIRPMMYVALSYDHRIVDGREAVQFLVHVKRLVEDPESLLLEA